MPAARIFASSTIFLVRPAERADAKEAVSADPDLSDEGKRRALHLAEELKDAKIMAIFTSEYRRTQQTTAPLEKSSGIIPQIVPAKEVKSLVARIQATDGNVLVVAHSDTLPQIIAALGIAKP